MKRNPSFSQSIPPKSRSGFVYASRVPQSPWVKIGFTRRVPHHRLKELSSSNSQDNFVLVDACFSTDALACEKYIHEWAKRLNWQRKKEFFNASNEQVKELFVNLPSFCSPKEVEYVALEDYENIGFTSLEKMAIKGDCYASFFVAQALLGKGEVSPAIVMFKASAHQGHPTAHIHEAFVKSFDDQKFDLEKLWKLFLPFHQSLQKEHAVPQDVEELLIQEQQSWKAHPTRAHSWAVFAEQAKNLNIGQVRKGLA